MDIEAFLDGEVLISIVRLVSFVAACMLTFWSYKSLVQRRKLKLSEFSDYMLIVVGIYWVAYLAWTIWNFSFRNFGTPSTSILIFNQRFGLLITLATFTALIKDRLLLGMVFEDLLERSALEVLEKRADKGDY